HPAVQHRTERPPVRKSLFRGEDDGGVRALLGGTTLPAELMEHSSQAQGISQAIGVRALLRQGYCLVVPCPPLVRIAKVPQRPGSIAATDHARVFPIEERNGAVLLGVVERHSLYTVRVRSGYRAQIEQRHPQGTVSYQEQGGVLGLLCQSQDLLAQGTGRLIL